MTYLYALLAGLLFGLGLIVSGMFDPSKVLGFLDLAGHWDPSLAVVMIGAVAVASIGFAFATRRGKTLSGDEFALPQNRSIDMRLVAGSLLFGIGWGLAGVCPGPDIVALGMGAPKAPVFFAAMLAGMLVFELVQRLSPTTGGRPEADPGSDDL